MNDRELTTTQRTGHVNPLLEAAFPLLNAISHFRYAPAPDDPAALRQKMIAEVRRFEKTCQALGLDYNVIVGARYGLCTSLDEAAALTPWGKSSIWAGNGLLVAFHNESGGGEKFFQLMAALLQQPEKYIDLLELLYFCLLLGFGGRYRVMENGLYRLEIVTQRLAQQIRRIRGDYAPSLSDPRVISPPQRRSSRGRNMRLASALLCVVVLCSLYIGLDARLDSAADRVEKRIYSLPLPKPLPLASGFSLPQLLRALEPEIAAEKVAVSVVDQRVTITLGGGDLFPSASSLPDPSYHPVIRLIARHLSLAPGVITVRGHSDNQRIATADFTSNHALAAGRAASVAQLLRQELSHPERINTASVAGAAPLVPNTTPKNRAINRRIDIVFSIATGANGIS
ncbi:type IVB secretion system protein IcmH/DotU [Sodalis sp. RH21]|uniref:type IVB secretion system protein IcmH/DotU n=1 Tax=unclassified Sodalis (in: enterobacteria) TaxID=2636512 RepID=UPI0039B39834